MAIRNRFFQDPKQSFFLFGPRGTGKSTWLHQHFPSAHFIDLLAPDIFRSFLARPERLQEVIEGTGAETIIIDEVQKVPELLDVVHLLMERKHGLRFVLTGSSARKLKRTGVDLLAGRAIVKTMHPFMAAETADSFTLESALQTGMVPLVTESINPRETLNSYVAIYLREEVQAEGLVRNIGAFSRFLEAASFSHGSVLNIAAIARECQVQRKTVEGYLQILEDLLLSFRVPIFARRSKRILVAHPKWYYFDAGVFRSLRPSGPIDSPQEIDGAALEGLVAQHLRAWSAYRGTGELFYWRTKSGVEVDFVLYGEKEFYAIEVKNSTRVQGKMLRGLRSFCEDYPEATPVLLYRGRERLRIHNIACVPCQNFLTALSPRQTIAYAIKA
ncbi:ATPase [Desulfolithobacter dissulfuricans]|uniref:ATPase n=1 Tax=Desulfolithobacter dissulfuricans TaxID=2795293 RepID=A0A915U206_9BACT|nr:ATP-binding protein [Desulfolithobacter dissulfuricans]BCO09729.1 ATPase [Desulfolithobacter dissulfuricans]